MCEDHQVTEVCKSRGATVSFQANIIESMTRVFEIKDRIIADNVIHFPFTIYVNPKRALRSSPSDCHVSPNICFHDISVKETCNTRKLNKIHICEWSM